MTTNHAGDAIRSRRRSRPSVSIDQHVIRPVRRTNLSAEIADRIAEQIALGKLNAGSRLQSERELSGHFWCRTVVRPRGDQGARESGACRRTAGRTEICPRPGSFRPHPGAFGARVG